MGTVTLAIGPKSYTVACADGQEAHIEALGAMIAEKYAMLGSARAPLEAQNLLFAALFLADELAEARKRSAAPPAPSSPTPTPPPAPAPDPAELEALRGTVERLEAELEAARKAAANAAPPPRQAPQFDLFGGGSGNAATGDDLAERLETLAARLEANADALEAAGASA